MSIVLTNPTYTPATVASGDDVNVKINVASTTDASSVKLRYSSAGSDMQINGGTSVAGGTRAITKTAKTIAKMMTVTGPAGFHKLTIIGQEIDENGADIGNPRERSVSIEIS
jgi:hypothetical protein